MTRKSQDCDSTYGLPGAVVGWVRRHASKNYWRVANCCELDDLIQDGLMVAYKCRSRYGEPGVDLDHPHFMALVKTAFYRHIGQILRGSRAEQALISRLGDMAGEMDEGDVLDRVARPVEPEQDFAVLVAQLPEMLRRVVLLYLTRPEALRGGRVHLDESDAAKLRRLTGFPVRHDFETELRAYLWERDHLDDPLPA